jgi:hypothetical protein
MSSPSATDPDDRPDSDVDDFQGDAHAADIVAPTGEEMPTATHAEVHHPPHSPATGSRRPAADGVADDRPGSTKQPA